MRFLKKLMGYLRRPGRIIIYLNDNTFLSRVFPSKMILKLRFREKMGKKLDLQNPATFNEKLQWLKLYDRKPVYTTMVDKAEVKQYVAQRIGQEYLIPTLGVWERFEDIDFDALPEQFVLKCSHDSGGLVICRDKSKLDLEAARQTIARSMQRNYFYMAREWPYKNVRPRILAEAYMEDEVSPYLPVYKFFCFSGKPCMIQVIQNDKQKDETIDYYSCDWELLDIRQNYPNSPQKLEKPAHLEQMVALAGKLAEDLPFIRVDLYHINGKIYFSEYTFYSDSGMQRYYPESADAWLGSMLTLPEK